jgi:hypothetical protein
MSVTVETDTVRLASQIAWHVGAYENAWRSSNTVSMASHWEQLDDICQDNPHASLIRGACAVAAASTRNTPCMSERDADVMHLRTVSGCQHLIREYVDGLQVTTLSELAAAA